MDTAKKILKFCGAMALTAWMLLLLTVAPAMEIRADENSTSTSSSSSGQTLYDALKAIYGDSGSSSSTSGSSSTNSSTSSSSSLTTDQLMKRMETEVIGPTVQDASLSELYHEDYKVYEERLGDGYTIYANVKNGGVTNRPVVIDVPRGVGVSMKKDGSDISFASKQVIETEGTYVLDLYVKGDEDSLTPFSGQEFLRAKFRFRIQYKKGVSGIVGESDMDAEEAPAEEPTEEEQDYEELPEDMRPDDYVFEEPEETEEESTEEAPEAKPLTKVNSELDSRYDESTGYYINTLRTGDSFYTSLPNGSITNEAVLVQEAEGLTYTAYRNGEIYESFTPGDYVKETGSFAVYVTKENDAAFVNEYKNGNPAFRFRIVQDSVCDIGIVTAPQGTVIRSVRYNGLDADSSVFINESTVHVDKDGDYEIVVEDEAGIREVSFTVDKTQPVFGVSTKPNEATVVYYSDDVYRCVLYRGNELVSDPDIVQTVTKAGKYKLYVYDRAGNVATSDFTVHYRINAAAVIAIISVIAVIAGVAVYLIRIRKKVKVV